MLNASSTERIIQRDKETMGFLVRRRSHESMKQLYNWFHACYGIIERSLGPALDKVVSECVKPIPDAGNKTAIEYACGSGLLTLKIAPFFKSVEARDLSGGMLSRARDRARKAGLDIAFREGNILAIDEKERSHDWVFVSCALHLFPPEDEAAILSRLLSVAREGVMIIDHNKQWNPLAALVEWLEGSFYDAFIKTDFSAVARKIGVRLFEEKTIGKCSVMTFRTKDQGDHRSPPC
jgi:ubiquinone/menaquinone biosynthesis C-methylase UbiE